MSSGNKVLPSNFYYLSTISGKEYQGCFWQESQIPSWTCIFPCSFSFCFSFAYNPSFLTGIIWSNIQFISLFLDHMLWTKVEETKKEKMYLIPWTVLGSQFLTSYNYSFHYTKVQTLSFKLL